MPSPHLRTAPCARVVVLAVLVGGCATPMAASDAGRDAGPRSDAPPPDGATAVDLVARLADPYAPARPAPGVAFLRSSRQPEPVAGMRDRDYNFFVARDGDRGVLVDETGPGVVTRLWLTVGGDPADPAIGGSARLHFEVDGAPVTFVPGEEGITVAALTSGTIPGFPRPWARDREAASGGYFVAVPIAYERSIRVSMTAPEALWNYYQVDGFALPPGTLVRSFDGAPTADDEAALAEATRLWETHEHPGAMETMAPRTLAAGESITRSIAGPAVVTELGVTAPADARARLLARIEVDGVLAAEARVSALFGTGPPAGDYRSAFTRSDAVSAHLFAPLPVDSSATITITLVEGAPLDVGLAVRAVAGSVPPDLGHFRAECRVSESDVPYDICEQEPTEEHPNVVVSALHTTAPAQYVGQSYSLLGPRTWWWALENDHEVWVDGDPSILGTGTEDYFGGGFYFALGPYASPVSGASGWDRRADAEASALTHLFRWHVVDAIPFTSDFRFEYESYIDGTRFDGCAFYYVFDR